jgi:hypothetical protein
MIAHSQNTPFIINQPEEEIVDVLGTDDDILMPQQAI